MPRICAAPSQSLPKRNFAGAHKQHMLYRTTGEMGFAATTRESVRGMPGGFTGDFAGMFRDTSLSSLKMLLARAELGRALQSEREERRAERLLEQRRAKALRIRKRKEARERRAGGRDRRGEGPRPDAPRGGGDRAAHRDLRVTARRAERKTTTIFS